MFSERVRGGALRAWLLLAMTGAAALQVVGVVWWKAALSGIACGLLCLCVMVLTEGECSRNPVYCWVQYGFLVVAAAAVLGWSADCWPEGESWPGVHLVLILLAGAAAWNGAEQGSRCAAVLWILAGILYAVILGTLCWEVKIENLSAESRGEDWLIFIGLIPAVATFLPREGFPTYKWAVVWSVVIATAVAAVTGGVLGQRAIAETNQPFYQLCKSLRIFGGSQRLETVGSVAMTLGLYSVLSLFINCAGQLTEKFRTGWGRRGILIACGLAAACCPATALISPIWLSLGALLLWGILPLITIRENNRKIMKKPGNNA